MSAANARDHFLFVGNPGTGKSTLINGLVGQPLFEARPSWDGCGVTIKFDEKDISGLGMIMDTPGLADDRLKHQAAEAITDALREGGFYRIFFVVTELNGRCLSAEKATVRAILEAAPTITEYAIIVNMVHPVWLDTMIAHPDNMQKWIATFMHGLPKETTHIHFMPHDDILANKVNVWHHAPQGVKEFIQNCPGMVIHSEDVQAVQVDSLQEMQEEFEQTMKILEGGAAEMETEMEQLKIAKEAAELQIEGPSPPPEEKSDDADSDKGSDAKGAGQETADTMPGGIRDGVCMLRDKAMGLFRNGWVAEA